MTVSTRTYIITLAVGQLAALTLTNGDLQQGMDDLQVTASGLVEYFADWKNHLKVIKDRIPPPRNLILLGRGYSLAAACTGALILGEASKFAAIGMQAGEFRHGPMELVSPSLTAMLFAGPRETQELNRRLYQDLNDAGARAMGHITRGSRSSNLHSHTAGRGHRISTGGDCACPVIDNSYGNGKQRGTRKIL